MSATTIAAPVFAVGMLLWLLGALVESQRTMFLGIGMAVLGGLVGAITYD